MKTPRNLSKIISMIEVENICELVIEFRSEAYSYLYGQWYFGRFDKEISEFPIHLINADWIIIKKKISQCDLKKTKNLKGT